MNIGILGLGAMGSGIALNFCKAGFGVSVFDFRQETARSHLEAGATCAPNVQALAHDADAVFTSVPASKEIKDLALRDDGLLSAMRAGTAWLELTTNAPASLVTRLAIAEGMTLGVKAGMDPVELWHAVPQGAIGRARTFDMLADLYAVEVQARLLRAEARLQGPRSRSTRRAKRVYSMEQAEVALP